MPVLPEGARGDLLDDPGEEVLVERDLGRRPAPAGQQQEEAHAREEGTGDPGRVRRDHGRHLVSRIAAAGTLPDEARGGRREGWRGEPGHAPLSYHRSPRVTRRL